MLGTDRGKFASFIYRQSNYTSGVMSHPGKGAKASPPTWAIMPSLLFSFIYRQKNIGEEH